MTCRMSRKIDNVIPAEILWEKYVNKEITLYEYGHYTDKEFLTSMERLGFDKTTIQKLMENTDA